MIENTIFIEKLGRQEGKLYKGFLVDGREPDGKRIRKHFIDLDDARECKIQEILHVLPSQMGK